MDKMIKLGISAAIGLALFLIVYLGLFLGNWVKADPNNYIVVRQFKKIVEIVDEPRAFFKVPFIQHVDKLPKIELVYDVKPTEINTKDKKRLIIDNFAVWKITDPKPMIRNLRTVENAEAKMGEIIYSIVRAEFGSLDYDQIISEKSDRGELNNMVTDKVNTVLKQENYGIQVVSVYMKRTDLPLENEKSVFSRMISERQSKAQEYLSIGDAEKNRTVADTDRQVKEMISKANADAQKIRGEGEAQAAKIYNTAFSQDPEFYNLYRKLQTYTTTINKETVIMIPSNSPWASILTGQNN